MEYKIWIQVEELDEESDHYENVGEPLALDVGYDTYEEASERLWAIGLALGAEMGPEERQRVREGVEREIVALRSERAGRSSELERLRAEVAQQRDLLQRPPEGEGRA